MASSKKRESNMAELSSLIDPNNDRIRSGVSSPEPRFRLHESSIDTFLREFSPERYPISLNPPGTHGRRPESPEGRTRSRTVTPSLDRDFDFRSLNITPEPVLGHPSASNFDSPPPYNADWSNNSDAEKTSTDPSASSTAVNATSSQRAEQPLLSPWYSEIPDGESLVQFLDEIQPPSYPSLSVSPPGRHTWAGDGKDESLWKSFVGYTPTEEEAAAYLRKAELESLALSKKQKQKLDAAAAAAAAKDKSRQKSPFSLRRRLEEEEEMAADGETISPPSPTFGRPRRDTGAWWIFGRKNKGDADKDAGEKATLENDKPDLFPRSTLSITAESSSSANELVSVSGVSASEETSFTAMLAQPLGASEAAQPTNEVSNANLPETPFQYETPSDVKQSTPAELASFNDLVSTAHEGVTQQPVDSFHPLHPTQTAFEDRLQDPRDAELDTPSGICVICNADLRFREGEDTGNWYLQLKNHFENAHGSWAARMPAWFGSDITAADTICADHGDVNLDIDMLDLEVSPAEHSRTEQPQEVVVDDLKEPQHNGQFILSTAGRLQEGGLTTISHLSELDERSISGKASELTSASTLTTSLPPPQWSRSHEGGRECYDFGCNQYFSTSGERDEHMEAEHNIKPRPSRPDTQLAYNLDLLRRLKASDGGTDSALLEQFDNSESVAVNVSEEIRSSEFKQLWHGFSTSLKMKDDIEFGSMPPPYFRMNASFDQASASSGHPPVLEKLNSRSLNEEEQFLERILGNIGPAPQLSSDRPTMSKDAHIESDDPMIAFQSQSEYLRGTSNPDTFNIRVKRQASRKGKERATEYELQAENYFNPTTAGPSFAAANPTPPGFRDLEAEELSRVKLAAMNTKFSTAASKAYDKLLAGSQRPQASKEFKEFVASLGTVEDIVDVGMAVVDMILAEEVPRSLKMVYCFLHVAYAISQSESSSPKRTTELGFQAGLSVFRSCLPAFAEIAGMPSERDIFDEIANVMWEELEYALKWIETWDGNEALNKVGYSGVEVEGLKDFMRTHCSPDSGGMAMDMTIDPKLLSIGTSEPAVGMKSLETLTSSPSKISQMSSWEEVVGCGTFAIVIRFLKDLKDTGIIFAYLCGGVCSSLASSFKKRVKFKDRATSANLVPDLQQNVVSYLNSYQYSGVENVTSTAVSLLKQGYIRTIREFENCMVDLARVRRRTQEEFCAFVFAIVWHCNSCATFVPDSLWASCRGEGDADYSLQYVDERLHRENRWFSGQLFEEPRTSNSVQRIMEVVMEDIANHPSVSQPDTAIDPHLPPITDEVNVASPLKVGMCAIDTLMVSPKPRKLLLQEDSPSNSTASSSSPNNDSMWESSPHGLPGSETSFSNPNSNNVTPDEIYTNPNLRNDRVFGSDYFSYPRPLATESMIISDAAPSPVPCVLATLPSPANVYMAEAEDSFSPTPLIGSSSNARGPQPAKSRKRKYLEGDGATSFPARRRKVATTGKRLYCDVPGCEEFASTSSNLSRHKRTKHGNAAVREASYHCENTGCDRVFYGPRGLGNLRTHMRKDHGGR
ncbi:hypothetical protein ABW21_db0200917 [Orbilia brochopaga]|nr:hypothetical protein ABW21_db0200917 [Drechslerella brochopaga]